MLQLQGCLSEDICIRIL